MFCLLCELLGFQIADIKDAENREVLCIHGDKIICA